MLPSARLRNPSISSRPRSPQDPHLAAGRPLLLGLVEIVGAAPVLMAPVLMAAVWMAAVLAVLLAAAPAGADSDAPQIDTAQTGDISLDGLAWREIGPALMGGRIADIAVDPRRPSTWYLAVGSGGVWKTTNAGTTWTPLFDDQPSYSIGCVTLDPSAPDTVWVGTGENVSGRHVGWGDGVYKSLDGGQTWRRMGLPDSQHIGDIVVDPRDSQVVYVAAEGPLWSSGGERGLFKTTDGGETWAPVLTVDADTGVTDIELDPRQPDVLYAATYERRRRVWSFLAGGPGSGIHKSTDGGATWQRLETGLPKGDMGKIGLAVSPVDPDVVYATIEASAEEKGFYRSIDAGASWERRNSYISGGTGPHYYQEIVASPHDKDRVYQMDVFLHHTGDGGKTMPVLGDGRQKHSDNHALWIDPEDPDHLLAGTDGGLYETFDRGTTWRHFGNLPISQLYKVALDDARPFYNVMIGAQDLGTLLGPSRTSNVEGVRNRDWTVPMGADGYACAFDAEKPELLYLQWQVGNLFRYDRTTSEALDIQPQPAPGDPPERWNWDSPIVASSHSPGRLFFGSYRVWQSDDRGHSWTAISQDLTRGTNRYELEMIDRVPSIDELYDNGAMSWYGTLTAMAESPLVDGLLYVGTDDGLIQVRDPESGEWRRATPPAGVPERAFVQEVTPSEHDADTVFAVLDAHKSGVFRPYLFASTDRGRTWRSIAGKTSEAKDADAEGIPAASIVWSIAQDHVDPNLLFAGTEFGVYFTLDGGATWKALDAGMPTIAVRDLAIQRRENDLVAASFGRGVYILDDYSPLRSLDQASTSGAVENEAGLFPVRDAVAYIPEVPMQAKGQPSQGSSAYTAPNPQFGALLTYHLDEVPKPAKEMRRETEKALAEEGKDVPFPGWDRLRQESLETEPKAFLTIFDEAGTAVRRLQSPARPGVHRVAWDLRWPAADPIDLSPPGFRPPWVEDARGPLVAPGTYRAQLQILRPDGTLEARGEAQEFRVRALDSNPSRNLSSVAQFQQQTRELWRQAQAIRGELSEIEAGLRHARPALEQSPKASDTTFATLAQVETELAELQRRLVGDPLRWRLDEPAVPSILGRLGRIAGGHWDTQLPPTATHLQGLDLAKSELDELRAELETLRKGKLADLEAELEEAAAPWTPGRSTHNRLP